VGLVTAVCLADKGFKVFCIDKDKVKVNMVRKAIAPIYEPNLEELLKRNKHRIIASIDAEHAIQESDVVMIAVGTPFDGKVIDLKYVKQASKKIGESIRGTYGYKVIVVKSTVIPGTTTDLVMPIVLGESNKTKEDVGFCMNPEFMREGNAVEDFQSPDRIVLGVTSARAEQMMRQVYAGFPNCNVFVTNPACAEMIKYSANSFLALCISYANEIARICERVKDVDSDEVFDGLILDRRISPMLRGKRIFPQLTSYLRPGCGFGGSCFPKDVKSLLAFEKKLGVEGGLLEALLYINRSQTKHVFSYGISVFGGKPETVAILGTAFKPDTDDIRESPGIKLAKVALEYNLKLRVHDYTALENTRAELGNKVIYCSTPMDAIRSADIIFITTIWNKYLEISDDEFEMNMKRNAVMIDCRGLYRNREKKSWRKKSGACLMLK
jgi:UDPglucose 6-dehydrogenase